MNNELTKFLSEYIELSDDEIETIIELDLVKKYEKGTMLLKEGTFETNSC